MIVKCDQCQTRFKIPDAKVTDKGVKVRCTKCQSVFRVTRAAGDGEDTRPRMGEAGPGASPAPPGPTWEDMLGGADVPPTSAPRAPTPMPVPRAPTPPPIARPPTPPPIKKAVPTPRSAEKAAPPPLRLPTPPPAAPPPLPPTKADDASPPQVDFSDPTSAALGVEDPLFGADVGTPAEPDHGLFDIPAAAPEAPEPTPLLDLPGPPEPPAPAAPAAPPTASVRIGVLRASKPSHAAAPAPAPAGRRTGGLLINLVLAAALVAVVAAVGNLYVDGGGLDGSLLSPRAFVSFITSPPKGFLTRDVSNGLYDTKGGRSVLFVRGDVENRTRAGGRVRVHAELWDGDLLVKAVDGLAGRGASPEELYALSSPQDVEALNQKLRTGSAEVRPGGRAPFLLVFDSYPAELQGLKVRVSASPARP